MSPTPNQQWQKVQREGKYAGPRYKVGGPPPRKQWNMTERDVAALLDDRRVFGERAKVETRAYREYAAGNKSTSELAEEYINSGNEFAFLVYVHDIEKNILRDAAGFNLIGPVVNPVPVDIDEQYLTAKAAEGVAAAVEINRVADSPGGGMSVHNTPEQLF